MFANSALKNPIITLLLDVVERVDADLFRRRSHPRGEIAGEVDKDEVEGDGGGQQHRPRRSGGSFVSFTSVLFVCVVNFTAYCRKTSKDNFQS